MPSLRTSSLITVFAALLFALLYATGATQLIDTFTLDAWFRLRGPAATADDIVIVALDERFIEAYPQRLGDLDRRFYARAIQALSDAGATVIGVDIFFPEASLEDNQADEALADAVLSNEVVLPQVRQNADGDAGFVAFNPLLEDAQRGVLTLSESARYFNPRFGELLSFSLAVLEATGQPPITESQTSERPIDFRGPAGTFKQLSLLDVYRGEFSYADVQDKIVLLGITLIGTDRDQIITPFGAMSGAEVNANEIHTLKHSRLRVLGAVPYSVLLLLGAFVFPPLVKRKRGVYFALSGALGIALVSFGVFLLELYVAPLWLALIPVGAYLSSSYRHLLSLDRRLSLKLMQLLDSAANARIDTTPTSLAQGFATKGRPTDAPEMLESLLDALGGVAGVLVLDKGTTKRGEVSAALLDVAGKTLASGHAHALGTLPHHLAEPVERDGVFIGVVALTLAAPPPPHLLSLLKSSVSTFGQLARYQALRERTSTLTDSVWPWKANSSLDKIEALALLGDLLATERGWLGALVETLPQAVFISSPYGYSIYKNAAARRLLGEDKNLLAALPKVLRISPEDFQKDYARTVERSDMLELGLSVRAPERSVLLSLRVVRESDDVKGVVGVVSDLSKLEELDKKRQDMVAMVAHDLRSPLTSIQGFAELLLSEASDADKEQLGIIRSEADRMRRMTDVFLDVSRLESEGFDLQTEPCNLAQLLRYAVATVGTQAAQKDIVTEVDAPTYLRVEADPDLLSRLLINLLSNAIKYSPSQTRVRARIVQENEHVIISIKDEGYGMTKKECERLFQKYDRADGEASRQASGTGLGLYLVKLISDAHGGSVKAMSELKQGSEFVVRLPVRQEAFVAG